MHRTVIATLAALALALASVAIWHWRFEADPGVLPETRIDDPLVGWTSPEHRQHELLEGEEGTVLVLERKGPKEKTPGVNLMFTRLEPLGYLHIRCEARWQGVEPGPKDYMFARFVAVMTDRTGRSYHPDGGFQVFGGSGDSDWRSYEVVQKITTDMQAYGLSIAMLGKSGRLEVRNLSVTAVRQRAWVRPATMVVVLGWASLFTGLIRSHPSKPGLGRSMVGAGLMVACGWILVFPQTKNFLHPVPRQFDLGAAEPATPPSKTAPSPAKPPAGTTKPPPSARPDPPPASDEVAGSPEGSGDDRAGEEAEEKRSSGALYRFLYQVDRRFGAAHLVLFTGITLTFLLITGSGSQWRLPLALALLAETVPELTDHLGGWDDWADLVSNVVGVGLAVLIWHKVPCLGKLTKTPVAA